MTDWKNAIPPHLFDSFYIDGSWIHAPSNPRKEIKSPSSEITVFSVPFATEADVDTAIVAAKRAFQSGPWPRLTPTQRAAMMHRLADILALRLPLLAELWTAQVGAPISLANRLAPLATARLRYFADLAASFEFETERPNQRGYARIISEPVGVSALIIPWNAALPILMNKLGAALAAGCTCIIKSSPESPMDAMIVAQCVDEAGFPRGVVNVVLANSEASSHLVASRDIDKVSFTGSVSTGSAIASTVAARMGRMTLELGGKSAAILLDDVDIETAMPTLEQFTMPFSGQFCFSQSRLLVPKARESELIDLFSARVRAFRVGDPWEGNTQIGPVLNRCQFDKIMSYIEHGVEEGANLVTGGRARDISNTGHYIEPTVFSNVGREMSIARDEIFGPVVTIQTYDSIDEAIAIANDTDFGLSGSVFGDPEKAYAIAKCIRTGQVGINSMELAPSVPFGGYKMSGIGREGGIEGLSAFLETKAILYSGQKAAVI